MKTAFSLPNDLFTALGREAKRTKVSRSGLIAQALREFLERRQTQQMMEKWNEVYSQEEDPEDRAFRLAARRHAAAIVARDPYDASR